MSGDQMKLTVDFNKGTDFSGFELCYKHDGKRRYVTQQKVLFRHFNPEIWHIDKILKVRFSFLQSVFFFFTLWDWI